jgi:hypothetical protein
MVDGPLTLIAHGRISNIYREKNVFESLQDWECERLNIPPVPEGIEVQQCSATFGSAASSPDRAAFATAEHGCLEEARCQPDWSEPLGSSSDG